MKRALAAAILLAALVGPAQAGAPRLDYATVARSILPPGEYGSVDLSNPHSVDQLKLYDALTPLFDQVTAQDVQADFKPEPLWNGTERATRVERPGRGGRIMRDQWDVPHVFGKTETDVMYGAGFAAAEDRGLLMELGRYAGRLACIDAPGFDAFTVALSGKTFVPSAQTEQRLAAQLRFLRDAGATGRQELADIDAYVAGVNAYRKAAQLPAIAPWTPTDVVATTCLLGARFGSGGGAEASRAELLSALEQQLGAAKGLSVWNDLRELQDPETPTTLATRFPYGPQQAGAPEAGNVVLADTSVQAPSAALHLMSNALLVSGKRSASGHPIMVAGPQLSYFYPEFFFEIDMEGGGVSVRGGSLAGIPNVLIGRGPDYGWSFTSAESDNVDTFAETLCGGDDHHYLYKGSCRAMTQFDAGVVKGSPGTPDTQVAFWETVHGPVIGYGTANGQRVALASDRSTRGRELKAALDVYDLSTGRVRSPQQFVSDLERFEMTFNGFYVDSKHIAYVSTGRLPIRAPGVDPGLPTVGTGAYDWRGFLAPAAHPHAIDPASGELVNWNNKPAPGFAASDLNWAYGAVQRVTLLKRGLDAKAKQTPTGIVTAMNTAATQDIRAVLEVPLLQALLQGSQAPSARDQQLLDLLVAWHDHGGSRLDRNLDGTIDDPGAAIMDAAWPGIADAVFRPVLGSLATRFEQLDPPFDLAMFAGATRYVDKDLRTLLGRAVKGPFANRYCGDGDLAACRTAVWAALDAAGNQLAAAQGPDPTAWRADATADRVHFAPGILQATMRWTNRPTFQQVLSFGGHR
jgi:acyl-homoserine lactone acylase PvdQ